MHYRVLGTAILLHLSKACSNSGETVGLRRSSMRDISLVTNGQRVTIATKELKQPFRYASQVFRGGFIQCGHFV